MMNSECWWSCTTVLNQCLVFWTMPEQKPQAVRACVNKTVRKIYIRGMHQVNYKRMQIRPLAILSFSSLSLLLSLSHHPSSAPSTWKEQCGIWGDILCSLSLLLCLIKPQLSFYPMLHTELYCRSAEIVDMCCGLLSQHLWGVNFRRWELY